MNKIIDMQSIEEVNDDAVHDSAYSYSFCFGRPSSTSGFFC